MSDKAPVLKMAKAGSPYGKAPAGGGVKIMGVENASPKTSRNPKVSKSISGPGPAFGESPRS